MKKGIHIVGIIISVLLISTMISCNKNSNPQMKNPLKHVILKGFDGMSANSLKNNVVMPNYRRIVIGLF